jgi:RimJ/RimL family protein N-acetyltransferase
MPEEPIVRELLLSDREALLDMYRSFDLLGAAQGLPPRTEEAREDWVGHILEADYSLGAWNGEGRLMGHVFLAFSDFGEAELAVFVHQDFRQRRLGTVLSRRLLEWAKQKNIRRIWALVASDNIPALRLLKRCGFRSAALTFPAIEMELDLSPASELPAHC